jgi:hypothetical protein
MTPREMEQKLLELSERYIKTRDPEVRAEYRRLHEEWKRAMGLAA